jgi:uncharacterized protein YecE (DUF72 family)
LCGVAGWSYADWQGIVYPRRTADSLRAVAALVDFVEINVSFYRTPRPEVVAAWGERTADLGTVFTAKLPRRATHDGVLDADEVSAFRAALEPLAAIGRLAALLAQFSYRLEAEPGAFGLLASIRAAYGGMAPLLLEVRHGSWRQLQAQQRAADLGFRLVHLDYAGMGRGFAGPDPRLAQPAGPAYLRLHGRNREAWFDREADRDATYDWLYTAAEVTEIERRLDALAAGAGTTMVAANNHFRGKAVVLALELGAWARGESVEVPPTLCDEYPQLRRIARRVQGGLF